MCLNPVKPAPNTKLCHLQLNFIKVRRSHINSGCWAVVQNGEPAADVMPSGGSLFFTSLTFSPFLTASGANTTNNCRRCPHTFFFYFPIDRPFSALASRAFHRLQILFASWVTAVLNKGNCGFDPGLLTFRAASGYRSNKPNCPCCGNLAKIRPL